MHSHVHHQAKKSDKKNTTIFEKLPQVIVDKIARYLANIYSSRLALASSSTYRLFQPTVDFQAFLRAGVWSNADGQVADGKVINKIEMFLEKHPEWLFRVGSVVRSGIKNEQNQCFYEQCYDQLSLFQMILFFHDVYLLKKIQPFLRKNYTHIAAKQWEQLKNGGSDIVKISPIMLPGDESQVKHIYSFDYVNFVYYVEKDAEGKIETYVNAEGKCYPVMYRLQENRDAIVFYDHHYYWVCLDHESKKVEKIELLIFEQTNEERLASFFQSMKWNSGRRTSDKEHAFISTHLKSYSNPKGIFLERTGIRYKREGEYYTDCKAESLIQRGILKCLSAFNEKKRVGSNPNSTEEEREHAAQAVEAALMYDGKMKALSPASTFLLFFQNEVSFGPTVPDFNPIQSKANRAFQIESCSKIIYERGSNRMIGADYSVVKGAFDAPVLSDDLPDRTIETHFKHDLAAMCEYERFTSGIFKKLRLKLNELNQSEDQSGVTLKK
jgi:hypothetical protein